MEKRIRVLIVDDSALIRLLLTKLLTSDPQIEVVGTASDPLQASQKIEELSPDVLTLDVEMPHMDGLTFLADLMNHHPLPVVMVSSLTQHGCETTIKALELGAVDFFPKPTLQQLNTSNDAALELLAKVKAAASARVVRRSASRSEALVAKLAPQQLMHQVILIGASTGGTEAIREILTSLPPNIPGIVMVQHMPPGFTSSFAQRLDKLCPFHVKEAQDGDRVQPGLALLAPGDFQTTLHRAYTGYYVQVQKSEPVNRHRPSVDALFNSAADSAKANVIAVLLTGMGEDGARGLYQLRQAGALTIAQDEATSVVFGMPRAAIALGAAEFVLPLPRIAQEIVRLLENMRPPMSA
ncbi:response regulator receiver modulated CheB methylesterase [Chthonomonas calidirosea]|uniref:Protein-glutamate methylesterase/protein-glutamine glutaminase n=1 Tax=Chthonomonas calidirosea (strain DSM 23976 / ICMP 18418 / T49) TaxID=1303518 RepID=S0ETA7_CHTCT|nr:chemotaxis response regulator protein-glutamate methylesterase [Chthonomonas calidirosea]CCW34315.1 response regulator receiver modulated CheB methylesterase [Chthonomonas calidirosea T49]CEK15129.1 response regulator receiver modulated CheB methylesterase [Chthonomonas calidirosea]